MLSKTFSLLLAVIVLAGSSSALALGYINLTSEYNSLTQKYTTLEEKLVKINSTLLALQQTYNGLKNKHLELTRKYVHLQASYDQLAKDYEALSTSYSKLEEKYEDLRSKYSSLKNSYNKLLNEYSNLKTKYNQLMGSYETLQQEYGELITEALLPPYTVISNRTVKWVFKTSYGSLLRWELPIDTYRKVITQPKPTEYLTLYNKETGETCYVMDYRPYIESTSFSKVIPDLYYEINDDWKFVYEVWYIVSQLTVYSADIGENPRWALETLTEGGGDCEDTAILAACMLKAAPTNLKIKLVYMDSDNLEHPKKVNHVALYVEGKDFSTFIETTSKTEMSPYTYVVGWYFEV